MSTLIKPKNFAIESLNATNVFDEITMARVISHICFRFGYRVVPFNKKDDPLKFSIESSDLTIEHVHKRLKTLNPDRKRPAKSVTIPLVDLRCGKVNVVLTFTVEVCRKGAHFCCDAKEIITDLSGLSACC